MTSKPIKTVAELKELLRNKGQLDFAIALNGGAYSRKEIFYHNKGRWGKEPQDPAYIIKYEDKFEVFNSIDGTTQILTEKQIMDKDYTNIGVAMKQNAFFHLMYEDTTKECDNCGSTEGYNNSSGSFQCDNCGHDEDDEEY